MSNLVVNRIDSAHMKRMFDMALENSDVNFLSATTKVSLEQVKNLKLDSGDAKDTASKKLQQKPPQPPKQPLQTGFSLSSFDALLDDVDAESWLVASGNESSISKTKSESFIESKKELVGSPIESSVSSEIRNSSLTPASVLDRRQTGSKGSFTSESPDFGKSTERYFFSRPKSAMDHGGSQSKDNHTRERNILQRPRSVGSENHGLASTTKKKPPKSISSILRPKSSMERAKPSEDALSSEHGKEAVPQRKSRIPRLGMASRRVAGPAASPEAKPKEDSKSTGRSLTSLAAKCRPFSKSTGPHKESRLPPLSPSPRPKSSLGRLNNGGTKDVKKSSSGGKKSTASVPPARPASALLHKTR
eukprot:g3717.t1